MCQIVNFKNQYLMSYCSTKITFSMLHTSKAAFTLGRIIGVWIDTYVFYQSVLQKKTYFGHCESLNFQMAPRASILNQFSQVRMHFKPENLFFPTMYNLWGSMMIYLWIANCLHSFRWVQIVIHRLIIMDPHKLYMVGKKRFSGLKCILVCENWLRIEALGAIWKFRNK